MIRIVQALMLMGMPGWGAVYAMEAESPLLADSPQARDEAARKKVKNPVKAEKKAEAKGKVKAKASNGDLRRICPAVPIFADPGSYGCDIVSMRPQPYYRPTVAALTLGHSYLG